MRNIKQNLSAEIKHKGVETLRTLTLRRRKVRRDETKQISKGVVDDDCFDTIPVGDKPP